MTDILVVDDEKDICWALEIALGEVIHHEDPTRH